MRHTLDQAIGTAPVSTVDVDNVVARARRRILGRRLAVAAGGTAFAAAGAVAALVLATVAPSPPSRGPTQIQPAAHGGAAPVRDGETRDQATQRLVVALTDGLTTALPGVRLADGPTAQPGVVVSFEQYSDAARYGADTVLTAATATGQGEVFLESWSGGRVPVPATPSTWPSNEPAPPVPLAWVGSCADLPTGDGVTFDGHVVVNDCADSIGPDGQTIVAVSERCLECPGQPTLRHDVYVTWSNARVSLSVARDTKRGGEDGSRSAPLLSRAQVIAIAMDPELTVTS
jgi:hypothetical protein